MRNKVFTLGFSNPIRTNVKTDLRILVAEDFLFNRELMKILFTQIGIEAEFVANGKQALQQAKETQFDLVFMDINMPEMDGLEATQRIRTEVALADQPYIVALSANASTDDREKSSQAGVNLHLPKPVDLKVIVSCIEKVERMWSGSASQSAAN